MIKHTDAVPDPRAVNQDKKNMLFSVSLFFMCLAQLFVSNLNFSIKLSPFLPPNTKFHLFFTAVVIDSVNEGAVSVWHTVMDRDQRFP